jgi:hypothetical protein
MTKVSRGAKLPHSLGATARVSVNMHDALEDTSWRRSLSKRSSYPCEGKRRQARLSFQYKVHLALISSPLLWSPGKLDVLDVYGRRRANGCTDKTSSTEDR